MREPPGLISVVVPVYGDGRDLDDLAARVQDVLDRAGPWELILVNDGSPPPTWARIRHLAASHSSIKGIDLERNAGQHNALLAGIRASVGDVVVTMDDDLQHPPEELPELLRQLHESGDDIVYGTPHAPVHGHRRQMGGTFTRRIVAYMSGVPHARVVSAFRVFKGTLRGAFVAAHGRRMFIDGVLCRASGKVSAVQVRHDPRRHGRSGYGLRGLVAVGVAMAGAFGIPRARIVALCTSGIASIAAGVALWPGIAVQPTVAGLLCGVAIGLGALLLGAGLGCAYLVWQGAASRRVAGYAIRTAVNVDPL